MNNSRDYIKIERTAKARRTTAGVVTYFFLAVWAVIVLFPFYWMLLTSVKSYSAYNAENIPQFFTLSPTLQNYADAFTQVPLGRYLLNTTIFTVVTTAVMLAVITLAAFAFARLDFRGKNVMFVLFLSLMMIPSELVIITNFVTITNLEMRNTFPGLILPDAVSSGSASVSAAPASVSVSAAASSAPDSSCTSSSVSDSAGAASSAPDSAGAVSSATLPASEPQPAHANTSVNAISNAVNLFIIFLLFPPVVR